MVRERRIWRSLLALLLMTLLQNVNANRFLDSDLSAVKSSYISFFVSTTYFKFVHLAYLFDLKNDG